MLGTLMKYEFKAIGRILLPLYAAWLIAAIMLGLSIRSDGAGSSPILITLSGILYGGATISAVLLTAIILIQRFYKNLLGNEGYLMFALPVSTGKHLTNKVISGAVWITVGVLVAILTAFALAISIEGFSSFFDEAKFFFGDIKILIKSEPSSLLCIVELIIIALTAAAETAVKIYASIAVGHQWGNHRVLGAILAYIGFGIAESVIGNLFGRLADTGILEVFQKLADDLSIMAQFHLSMLIVFLVTALVAAIYWFICWKLLDQRLNLE